MKRIFVVFGFFVLSAGLAAQPNIKFNDTRHEFGTVPEGSYPTWVFKFANTGNEDLKLTDVKASCGCTSPQWSREPIKPGDSGEVKVVFNSNGYAGRQFAKNVTVTTNIMDNGQPRLEILFIQGTVMAKVVEPPQYPVKFTETKHDLGSIKPGKKMVWPVMIMNEGDSVLTVKEIKSSCPCITFQKGVITIPPHQTAGFNATINTKGNTKTSFSENIKVTTNIPVANTKALSDRGYQVFAIVEDVKKKK